MRNDTMSKLTTKQLGDAGEYYALSQFIFAGRAAAKMPDNWPEYDIAVDFNGDLKKVSVKTRIKLNGDFSTEHCKFSAKDSFDYIAFIFKSGEELNSWIVPRDVAMNEGITSKSVDEDYRRLSFKQLDEKMKVYKDNWPLQEN